MSRLKQFFHKLSIRKKMLTILCLVGMLPVLVLGISLGINSYRTVLKYREKDMTNTLQQACGIVDYQMYACQQMMNYFDIQPGCHKFSGVRSDKEAPAL